jgi:hypothetical protein
MGLDDGDASSYSSSTSSTSNTSSTTEQPAETPAEQTPAEPTEKPQVTVTLKDPQAEILKKGITTAKPKTVKKP